MYYVFSGPSSSAPRRRYYTHSSGSATSITLFTRWWQSSPDRRCGDLFQFFINTFLHFLQTSYQFIASGFNLCFQRNRSRRSRRSRNLPRTPRCFNLEIYSVYPAMPRPARTSRNALIKKEMQLGDDTETPSYYVLLEADKTQTLSLLLQQGAVCLFASSEVFVAVTGG